MAGMCILQVAAQTQADRLSALQETVAVEVRLQDRSSFEDVARGRGRYSTERAVWEAVVGVD